MLDVGCFSIGCLTLSVLDALLSECVVSDEMYCVSSSVLCAAVSASSVFVPCLRFELLNFVAVCFLWIISLEPPLIPIAWVLFVGYISLSDVNRGSTSHCHYLPLARPSLRSLATAFICFMYCALNPPSEFAFSRSSFFVHSDRFRWDHSH